MKDFNNAMQHRKKLHGLYIGEVVNSVDPKKRNRIQVNINGITDEVDKIEDYLWAEQGGPIAKGSKTTVGISTSPSKGEMVYIMFLNGSPSHPIYFAMVRGGSDASSDYDDNYVIHTPNGQKIIVGKTNLKLVNGGASITMTNDTITFDATNIILNGSSLVDINSTTLTHNDTNVGDTHTHSEPSAVSWSTSGATVTDVPN